MKCQICGDKYELCRSIDLNDGVFHWQSVACSYRCAQKYMANKAAAEAELAEKKKAKKAVKPVEVFVDDSKQ